MEAGEGEGEDFVNFLLRLCFCCFALICFCHFNGHRIMLRNADGKS